MIVGLVIVTVEELLPSLPPFLYVGCYRLRWIVLFFFCAINFYLIKKKKMMTQVDDGNYWFDWF
jgi:hypothetical protein